MSQYSKFNHHFQLGNKHKSWNENEKAAGEFLEAYQVAKNSDGYFESQNPTQASVALRKWAISLADYYRFNDNYEAAAETLDTAINDLEEKDHFKDAKRIERDLGNLHAHRRFVEMEQHLVQGDYELALETAGAVIRYYSEIDDRDSQEWAITKRREIQAIISETNGDLEDAASLHRDIGESGSISNQRRDWHTHRGDICDAKKLALDGHYKEAKSQLLRIQQRTDQLESEANDLEVVLDSIITYEEGKREVFTESLHRLSSEESSGRTPPMRLEYNYEDPLSVIHAAQWLRTYNVDAEMLTMAVEVALEASLIPMQSGEVAANVGLEDVKLRDQWLMQLPSPFAQRITQIRLDRSVPQTDYSGLGSRLFTVLELYLAMFGEYYGNRKWGEDWRKHLSDDGKSKNMSIGDLANVFTKCSDILESGSAVAELINGSSSKPSVVQLRNDIGHGKTDDVRSDQYETFQNRVFSIFRESVEDSPAIGKMIETRGQGAFEVDLVQIKWWRPQPRVYIQTNMDLDEGTLYYFPQDMIIAASEKGQTKIEEEKIIEISTDRVLSKST